MSKSLRVLAAVGTCALAAPAFAHHPGGPGNSGGAGPINTISASTIPAGISVVAITYDRINLDPLSDATLKMESEKAHDAGEHAHIHSLKSISSPALNYAYGITNDLMIAVRLPYVIRSDIREGHFHHDEGAEIHRAGDADGIGDISALAQWRFINNQASGFEAAVLAGFKAPTGSTDEDDREGERFAAEFQPGSGSWDGMFGLALTQRVGKWSFDASGIYTVITKGTQDSDLGDRFHYGAAISYRITGMGPANSVMFHGAKPHDDGVDAHGHVHTETSGPALDLILEVNGEWHSRQTEGGERDPNSGGNTIMIAPGLRLSQDKWSAFASIGLPIVNDLNGIQAEADWRLVTGVSFSF